MTFGGHIAYTDRSHFIIIIINKQGQMKARMQILIMQVENEFKYTSNHHVIVDSTSF